MTVRRTGGSPKFLGELGKDAAMSDVVGRLKSVLLEEEEFTEAAIRAALLPGDDDQEL
jgi:hypothetical protein